MLDGYLRQSWRWDELASRGDEPPDSWALAQVALAAEALFSLSNGRDDEVAAFLSSAQDLLSTVTSRRSVDVAGWADLIRGVVLVAHADWPSFIDCQRGAVTFSEPSPFSRKSDLSLALHDFLPRCACWRPPADDPDIVDFAKPGVVDQAGDPPRQKPGSQIQDVKGDSTAEGFWRRTQSGKWAFVKQAMKEQPVAQAVPVKGAKNAAGNANPLLEKFKSFLRGADRTGNPAGNGSPDKKGNGPKPPQHPLSVAAGLIRKIIPGLKSDKHRQAAAQAVSDAQKIMGRDASPPARKPSRSQVVDSIKEAGKIIKDYRSKSAQGGDVKKALDAHADNLAGIHKALTGQVAAEKQKAKHEQDKEREWKALPPSRKRAEVEKADPSEATSRAVSVARQIRKILVEGKVTPKKLADEVAKKIPALTRREALHVMRQVLPPGTPGSSEHMKTSGEIARHISKSILDNPAAVTGHAAKPDVISDVASNRRADRHVQSALANAADVSHADAELKRNEKAQDELVKSVLRAGEGKDRSRIVQAMMEMADSMRSSWKQRDAANVRARDKLVGSLKSVGSKCPINAEISPELSDSQKKSVKDAMAFVGDVLRNHPGINLSFQQSKRSCCVNKDGSSTISLGKLANSVTVVHEIGHAIERQVPGVNEMVQKFRAERVGKEKPSKIECPWRDDAIGYKDDFARTFGTEYQGHYAGRVYKGGDTEIVSMGLEHMFHDPVHFAKNDPEYFKLMCGILDGSKREAK
jgi:hypothetical protein